MAGEMLLANAEAIFGENVALRNPRLLPSSAIAAGLLGGYIVIFGALTDLRRTGASRVSQIIAGSASIILAVFLFAGGSFDVYSIVVEFNVNGDRLGERFIEHLTFVVISIITGCFAGIGLGLWAARDERVAPVILYAVGIIQTIPSLALFGLLLFPLAQLGDQLFTSVLVFFVLALAVAGAFIVVFNLLQARLPPPARIALLIVSALATAVPLALFVVVLVSFLFRISFLAVTTPEFTSQNTLVFILLAITLVLALIGGTRMAEKRLKPALPYLRYGFLALTLGIIAITLYQASTDFLRNVDSFAELTVRDLGVSGIGVAPALIALTLYSLLPLVRNTYAGLRNVDPAIIDSGRGMGMTASQIFFRIELPLAFPIIMAGVRNAGIALVGIGTIATVIGGGGLGDFVLQGIINTSIDLILLGAIPAILLALLLDFGLRAFENLVTSPGIKQARE
jgi:ABC-type proline/glycine betaine transport system permease subunit